MKTAMLAYTSPITEELTHVKYDLSKGERPNTGLIDSLIANNISFSLTYY